MYIDEGFNALRGICTSLKGYPLVDIAINSDSIQVSPLNNVELDSQNESVQLKIGNPPDKNVKHWLFQPGQSGNPAGKPAGTKNSYQMGEPITQETLNKLETFSKPELIKLIKKVSGAVWGVGIMSDDEAFEAVRLKLLHTGLTSESANSSLNVLKEWADRTKGKPAQSIAMKIETNPLEKMSTDRLVRLEQKVSQMLGADAVIIPPMPEKLGDDE